MQTGAHQETLGTVLASFFPVENSFLLSYSNHLFCEFMPIYTEGM